MSDLWRYIIVFNIGVIIFVVFHTYIRLITFLNDYPSFMMKIWKKLLQIERDIKELKK